MVNRYALHIFVHNVLCSDEKRQGDGYAIGFRDSENQDEFDQYLCDKCIVENDDESTMDIQPYKIDNRVFDRDFIQKHNKSAKFKSFAAQEQVSNVKIRIEHN